MPTLTEVIIISISSSVVFSLIAFLSTILWVRLRRRRASVLLSQRALEQGQISQNNAVHTPGQGTFRSSFTFPYSTPREWDVIRSSETVHETGQDIERRRSLFDIFSTRSSRHQQQDEERNDVPLDSITTTSTKTDQTQLGDEKAAALESVVPQSDSKPNHVFEPQGQDTTDDKVGQCEDGDTLSVTTVRRLPCEVDTGTDSLAPDMMLLKRHSTGTLGHLPGSPPKLPVPPLPAHYVPGQSRLVKRNSALDLSNMSLDTADSSILNLSPQRNRFSDGLDIGLKDQSRNELRYSISRYSVSSAGSRRLTKEYPSPKRSVSAPHTGHSPFVTRVQPPAPDFQRRPSEAARSLQQAGESTGSVSRSLTSAQPLAARPRDQYSRPPPPTYRLKEPSGFGNQLSSGTGLYDRSVLKPTTGNERNFGLHSANSSISGSPPKSYRNSASSLRSIKSGGVPVKRGHRRQNCIRIPIYAPVPVRNSLATTVEEPEESPEPKELNKQEDGCKRGSIETEHKTVAAQQSFDEGPAASDLIESPFETAQSSPDGSSESTPGKPSSSPCPKRFAPPRRSALRGPPVSARKTLADLSAVANTNRPPPPPRSATGSLNKNALDLGAKLIQNMERNNNSNIIGGASHFGYGGDQKTPVARLPRTVSLRGRVPESYTMDPLSPLPEADTPREEDELIDDDEEDTSETPKAGNSPTNTVTPSRDGSSSFVRTPGSIYDQYGFLKEWKA